MTQQLVITNSGVSPYFGSSLAMSANGKTLYVGAAKATVSINTMVGGFYTFTQSGSVWNQEVSTLTTGSGAATNDMQSFVCTTSGFGDVFVMSGLGTSTGSIWGFV